MNIILSKSIDEICDLILVRHNDIERNMSDDSGAGTI